MKLTLWYSIYLIKAHAFDPKLIALDFVSTDKIFARSIKDVFKVVLDQESVPLPPTQVKSSLRLTCVKYPATFRLASYQ